MRRIIHHLQRHCHVPTVSALAFLTFAVSALGLGAALGIEESSFLSLTVDKISVVADGGDVQTARLSIETGSPEEITLAAVMVNMEAMHSNLARGYFAWTEESGFMSVSDTSSSLYGSRFVKLLPSSERVIDRDRGRVTYVFRWSAFPGHSAMSIDNIGYAYSEPGRGFSSGWRAVHSPRTRFTVASPSGASVFHSLTTDLPYILADGYNTQTARLTLSTRDPDAVDLAAILVNYSDAASGTGRGYFYWRKNTGFAARDSASYGTQYVTFLPYLSERVVDRRGGFLTFVFRWRPNINYGESPDTDIGYFFEESANEYSVGWRLADTSFSVVNAITTPEDSPKDVVILGADGEIVASWKPPVRYGGSRILSYAVDYAPSPDFLPKTRITTSTTALRITGLDPLTLYYVRVEAVNAVGGGLWSPVFAVKPAPVPIDHVLIAGGAAAEGGGTALSRVQPYRNLMLAGGAFAPLVEAGEDTSTTRRETIASSFANAVYGAATGTPSAVLATRHSTSSVTFRDLQKQTPMFSGMISAVTTSARLASEGGRAHRVRAILAVAGSPDNPVRYARDLLLLRRDFETEVSRHTGQASSSVWLFTHQRPVFAGALAASSSALATIEFSASSADQMTRLVGPSYFLPGADAGSFTNDGYRWLGEYYARAYRHTIHQGYPWMPLSPLSAVRRDNVITVRFTVPTPPITLDTARIPAVRNFGFQFAEEGGATSTAIIGVRIGSPDTVDIILNHTPRGRRGRVLYAWPGQNDFSATGTPRLLTGNLRDSDRTPSLYGYDLFNWSVQFELPVQVEQAASAT